MQSLTVCGAILTALIAGFLTGFSLILAIGAQNAFVLRQGLRREHVGLVVAICVVSDGLLIMAGVTFLGALLPSIPGLSEVMRWVGAAFLICYGALRFRAALRGGESLQPSAVEASSAYRVAMTCLLLTWANPHVYIDTVVLLGSIAAQYAPFDVLFGAGAAIASLVFFTALGFGARLLAPVFTSPRAWVALEVLIGLVMWAIAFALLRAGLA
ncbi:LysE/ArgO family amino acid transporter [Aestuariivirga sp.]|uniref:LysE/ArgO family amino acid transporter n=1 Tax=Aestuariivirga sp. TaxID=2650926 RepID=UPI0025B9999F|nr:LysE/ArgO family amino acid transporter [Aestuariivirga sp.]